jgi:hypothetical protein
MQMRRLPAVRRLLEHSIDPNSPGCEVDILKARACGIDRSTPGCTDTGPASGLEYSLEPGTA